MWLCILTEPCDWTLWWNLVMEPCDGTLWWNLVMEPCDETLWWNLVTKPCDETLWWNLGHVPCDCTLSNLDLKINNTALPMATYPKVLGLTLDPRLTYSTHIYISVQEHKPLQLQMIKVLTATGLANYKAVMRPTLEYASYIWSPLILDQH